MSTKPGYADHDPESVERDAPTEQFQAATPPPAKEQVTSSLLTAASSDRCGNCGAQLAPDQRYCVVCGERRGRARFAGAMFGSSAPAAAAPEKVIPVSGGAVRVSRFPPGITLIAGILTLLVAMGLGILIGHDSSTKSQVVSHQQPINVTVNGGGAGTGSSSGTTGAAGSGSSSTSTPSTSGSASKAAGKPASAAAQAKGNQAAVTKGAAAASTVLGGTKVKVAPPTVQQGGACPAGSAGCTGKKFTGNFFGG
ncbi:MAG: hypothetical protein ACYDHH_10810 [Solirubrobacteraceae bacterium]